MKHRLVHERLEDKTAQAQLANHLRLRYNFNPAMSEALFRDAVFVRMLSGTDGREDGQVIRYFPRLSEPAGKPLTDCELVAVRLTLYAAGDDKYRARHGLSALRRRLIQRLTQEAIAQGAAPTQEDLASLLRCDRSTIVRDLAVLRRHGVEVRTRGDFTDQGRGTTHKELILRVYLMGYRPSKVARRTGHSLEAIEHYLRDFFRIVSLKREGKGATAICRLTGCSQRLIGEHLQVYERLHQDDSLAEPLEKQLQFYNEGHSPLVEKGGAK